MQELNLSVLLSGMLIGLSGVVLMTLRGIPRKLFIAFQRQFTVTVDIISGDRLFDWLKEWFDAHEYSKRGRLLSASCNLAPDAIFSADSGKKLEILFTPAPGAHVIRFQHRWILVRRDRKEVSNARNEWTGYRETFTLQYLGRGQSLIRDLLREAKEYAERDTQSKVSIFTATVYEGWRCVGHHAVRTLDSVVLDEGVLETIVRDITLFRERREWYRNLGIPYHRGHLYYGPPGSGKSSLATALAGAFSMPLYLMNPSSMSDEKFRDYLSAVPAYSILLLEDIDALFVDRGAQQKSTLSFSAFLNGLDGVSAREGLLVIMTTNHIERLDPALIRPGRVDLQIELGNASKHQVRHLFLKFYPEEHRLSEHFAHNIPGGKHSMAALQEFLLRNDKSPGHAVAQAMVEFAESSVVKEECEV